jgi:uncharacterized integral membrane protein
MTERPGSAASSEPEPQASDAAAADRPPDSPERKDPLRRSRTSSAWLAVVLLAVVLVVLVVFIAQNTQRVEVSFFGWNGHPPLAVALMIAAAGGLILAATAATLRMWQIRRRVRRT